MLSGLPTSDVSDLIFSQFSIDYCQKCVCFRGSAPGRIGGLMGGGLNDGLFQKRWTFVTLPSVLSTVCIAQNWYLAHSLPIEFKDPCPKILAHKSEIKVICSQLCIAHLKSDLFCGEYNLPGTYNLILGCLCDFSGLKRLSHRSS